MASVKPNTTIKEYQNFIKEVYELSNDRYFSAQDMLTNMERFAMRGLKGIRKRDKGKIRMNLLISFSWFMSMMNQLHIDIENEVWKRFPHTCSYCAVCPCSCKEKKVEQRQKVVIEEEKRPQILEGFQDMFGKIYPPASRTIEHAGIHLAEEIGEFGEAILTYRGGHEEADFDEIPLEAADLFSCFMGVFNSAGINVAKELAVMFANNCHVCKSAPCRCRFTDIADFQS